ncbi:hypothetical protein CLOM_g27 [Closterium sp. NIES-68]|nr:hypothetical protein CLOM_g27 [Closterium sp. NIES-68]GJP69121.1 hypothetical protein CLOP_g25745 [Closterium sp. NIES-67]GJP73561.1 hypothetical protein CLOP_g4257 [Closterium sp. NIES-67]
MEEGDAAVAVRVLKERLTWQPSAVESGERDTSTRAMEGGDTGRLTEIEGDANRRVSRVIQTGEGRVSHVIQTVELVAENEGNRSRLYGMLRDVVCDGLCLSLLLLGPRGCGKTLVLHRVLADLRSSHDTPPFLAVHLDGRMHADDRAALKEMARQLALSLPQLDALSLHSFSDNVRVLHHVLRLCAQASRSLIVVLDEFDQFASRGKQGILYLLLDVMHSPDTHLAVIGVSASQDADQLLEKRVRSRFSNRKIVFLPPQPEDLIRLLLSTLTLPLERPPSLPAANGLSEAPSWPAFASAFNKQAHTLFQNPTVLAVLLQSTAVNRTVPHLFKLGFRAVCEMVRRGGQTLSVPDFERAYAATTQPIRQQMLSALSVLELYLLVALHRTEARAAATAASGRRAGGGGGGSSAPVGASAAATAAAGAGGAGGAGGALEGTASGSHPINFHTAFMEYESRRVAAKGSVSDVFSQESAMQAYGRLIDANFVAVASGQLSTSVEELEFSPARLLVTARELEEATSKNPRVPLELRNWLQQGLHEGAPLM